MLLPEKNVFIRNYHAVAKWKKSLEFLLFFKRQECWDSCDLISVLMVNPGSFVLTVKTSPHLGQDSSDLLWTDTFNQCNPAVNDPKEKSSRKHENVHASALAIAKRHPNNHQKQSSLQPGGKEQSILRKLRYLDIFSIYNTILKMKNYRFWCLDVNVIKWLQGKQRNALEVFSLIQDYSSEVIINQKIHRKCIFILT